MKTGIIGAMDVEIKTLTDAMTSRAEQSKAGMTFYEGRLGAQDVVIVQSGVGKVQAALCVQVLADLFGVDRIINTGVAGSLDNRINIGDIVVSTEAVYHDVDATVFGYKKGEVPQTGMLFYPADKKMQQMALAACEKGTPAVTAFSGRIASGDQFIHEREVKEAIRHDFDALCVEMEGAGIAQAAWKNGIPFVILRAISDKADESVEMSYDMFEKIAAERCAALVQAMLA